MNDYVIVASIIVIRNSINCAALLGVTRCHHRTACIHVVPKFIRSMSHSAICNDLIGLLKLCRVEGLRLYIAVVIYTRHLSRWRCRGLLLFLKWMLPLIYLTAFMFVWIIRDPASPPEEASISFFFNTDTHPVSFSAVSVIAIQFLNTWTMFSSLLPQFWKCLFSSKDGVSQYFCPYSVCTSHWRWVFGSRSAFTVTPEVLNWD